VRWLRILRRGRKPPTFEADRFLRGARGVVHVGANSGQERALYAGLGLAVVWIEPLPSIFAELTVNIAGLPRQRALQCLVTDRDGVEYEFHVASNRGESSSILELKQHKDVWPKVGYVASLKLRSKTLATLLGDEGIDLDAYDALVMDTQGSELLVLRGAEPILHGFRYVKTEVPDFEAYAGCCRLADIEAFLSQRGYREVARREFARHAAGGRYYDVVFEQTRAP
jgi:FkbM family methyltransferase